MNESAAAVSPARSVRAWLNYVRKTPHRPHDYNYEPPPSTPLSTVEIEPHLMEVSDVRSGRAFELDRHGFAHVQHDSAMHDWHAFRRSESVRGRYLAEVKEHLLSVTGAKEVEIFDHTLRDSSVTHGSAAMREPVRRVHNDQTFASAPGRVLRHFGAGRIGDRLSGRYAIVNHWRPIGEPVQRAPLAVCDASSLSAGDLIETDLFYPEWSGETFSIAFNPGHRWYWYPEQSASTVTLLKVFDSISEGVARLTAHTAFDAPDCPASAPPRRSIEVRAFVFY